MVANSTNGPNAGWLLRVRRLRLLGVAFLVSGLAYGAASGYLWARQSQMIFMPQRELTSTPADYDLPYQDVMIPVADEHGNTQDLHAWWIGPSRNPDRVLLYLHGSALNISANIEHAKRFYGWGFSVLLVSYRGYGRSEGDFPNETQVYQDAEAAWHYLVDRLGIDPARIMIYGHSLGGAVAINLARRHPEAGALTVEGTFTSIADMARRDRIYAIFPIDLILTQRFDSLSKITHVQVPVLFIHGTGDDFVPPQMSRRLYEQAKAPKALRLIPGGGHNNSARVGGQTYSQTVRDFAKQFLP